MAVLIKSPAIRQRFFHLIVHLQFSSGNYCSWTVKEKRIGISRHCHCNRIRSQHGLFAECRNHNCLRVGACHTDQPLIACHFCIKSGNAKMIGLTDTDNAHTCFFRFFNCLFHGKNTDQLSHSVMSVNNSRNRCFKYYLWFGVRMDRSLFNTLVIANHSLHSMALNTIKICCQKHILNFCALFIIKTKSLKYIGTKLI